MSEVLHGIIIFTNKFKLNNLIILVDYNKIQALTDIKDGLPLENLIKFKSFNIHTININGHSFNEMKEKLI